MNMGLIIIFMLIVVIIVGNITLYWGDITYNNTTRSTKRQGKRENKSAINRVKKMIGKIKTDDIYKYVTDSNAINKGLRRNIVNCIGDTRRFIRDIDNEDPFHDSYEKLLEIYEPYFVSLAGITDDESLTKQFRKDKEMLKKFYEALNTLNHDLVNVRDEYTKSKYKEITSFL